MDTRLPPAIRQALQHFMPLSESERRSVDMEVAIWNASHHARNDARALRLQQAEQTRNDWSAKV